MKSSKLNKGLGLVGLLAIAIIGLAIAFANRPPIDQDQMSLDIPYGEDGVGSTTTDVDDPVLRALNQSLGRGTPGETRAGDTLLKQETANRSVAPSSPPAPVPPVAQSAGGVGGGITGSAPAPNGGDAYLAAADRKIVQTASLRLQVKEVGGGFEEVGRIATGAGGFIASSNFSYQGDQQVASVTIRVPAERYQEVLAQLRGLGTRVDSETSTASDISEEYTDVTARLRNLEATEQTLLGFLAQAKNVSEVLQIQDRLNNTRNEIERAKGRVQLLDRLSDLATITLHLRPAVAGSGSGGPSTGLGAEVREAWDDSLAFLEGVAAAVVTVVVFVWWLPFLAIPAIFLARRYVRPLPPTGIVD